jgi:hypothetical protein
MPQITQDGFEPNKNAKRLWRYTRKSKSDYAGVSLPGLFETHNFWSDAVCVTLILIGEIYGLYNLWAAARGQFRPAFVVGLFLIDVLAAVLLHLLRGPQCEAENRAVAAAGTEGGHFDQLEFKKKAKWLKIWRLPFFVLIVAVALFKIGAFYSFVGEFTPIVLSVIVSYAIVAALQIRSTGAFGAEVITSWMIGSQQRSFESTHGADFVEENYHAWFPASTTSNLKAVQAGRYSVRLDAKSGQFSLEGTGILMDSDLYKLAHDQDMPEGTRTVAIIGLGLQLVILDSQPRMGQPVANPQHVLMNNH